MERMSYMQKMSSSHNVAAVTFGSRPQSKTVVQDNGGEREEDGGDNINTDDAADTTLHAAQLGLVNNSSLRRARETDAFNAI